MYKYLVSGFWPKWVRGNVSGYFCPRSHMWVNQALSINLYFQICVGIFIPKPVLLSNKAAGNYGRLKTFRL